jgi:hypothetical protein
METEDLSRIRKVEMAYVVFQQLHKNGVHELAGLAVERISWGLAELSRMKQQLGGSSRMHPKISSRARMGGDTDTQGVTESEATKIGSMRDTVMGNTGMLLLEDPGLQAFVPQAFAPLTWTLGQWDPGPGVEVHMQVKEEQKYDQKWAMHSTYDDDAKQSPLTIEAVRAASRSSEQLQGQGSAPGSAPLRYATFSNGRLQEQPPGLKSPTSLLGSLTVEQYERRTETDLQHPAPRHLRQHSYLTAKAPEDQHATAADGMNPTRIVPPFTRPQSQILPKSAATTVAQLEPNVHPSWAARPAIPHASFSDFAPYYPQHIGRRDKTVPSNIPKPSWQHALPLNMSSTSGESATVTADQTEAERWESCYRR